MIIGVSGKIGSGKDTIGNIIRYLEAHKHIDMVNQKEHITIEYELNGNFKENSTFEIRKFADKLKDIVCLLIGCTREQLEDIDFKNKELSEEWWYWKVYSNIKEDKFELIPYNKEDGFYDRKPNYRGHYLVKLTPRKLLQLLGTECGRQIIHPNIWVNALFADYKGHGKFKLKEKPNTYEVVGYSNWIITDVRFPNEAKAIKDRGGIVIRVNRESKEQRKLRARLNDELEDGSYRIGSSEMVMHTGKQGKINFEVELLGQASSINEHESETALDNYEFDYVIDNNGSIEELVEKVKDILIKTKIL